jgi:hypothetical protein
MGFETKIEALKTAIELIDQKRTSKAHPNVQKRSNRFETEEKDELVPTPLLQQEPTEQCEQADLGVEAAVVVPVKPPRAATLPNGMVFPPSSLGLLIHTV